MRTKEVQNDCREARRMKISLGLGVLYVAFLMSFVHADPYSDCATYGNCPTAGAKTTINQFNSTNASVNNSQLLQGLTPQQVANLYIETDPIFSAWLSTFLFNYNQTTPAINYVNSNPLQCWNATSNGFNETYANTKYWRTTTDQTSLSGTKSGNYSLSSTGNFTMNLKNVTNANGDMVDYCSFDTEFSSGLCKTTINPNHKSIPPFAVECYTDTFLGGDSCSIQIQDGGKFEELTTFFDISDPATGISNVVWDRSNQIQEFGNGVLHVQENTRIVSFLTGQPIYLGLAEQFSISTANGAWTFNPRELGINNGWLKYMWNIDFANMTNATISKNLWVNGSTTLNNTLMTNLNVTNQTTVNNLVVTGNFSAKRPYLNAYDNTTQNFLNTANVQVMNISTTEDNWLISMQGNQNVTFKQTGDYLCILSPEFTNTASTANIAFWFQKANSTTGFTDVPWTNSRYTISNNEYLAPAIPFQFDIDNPATDKVRFMWYSTSTNSQIVSITGLTSPTRPSVPSVILNCNKLSELT